MAKIKIKANEVVADYLYGDGSNITNLPPPTETDPCFCAWCNSGSPILSTITDSTCCTSVDVQNRTLNDCAGTTVVGWNDPNALCVCGASTQVYGNMWTICSDGCFTGSVGCATNASVLCGCLGCSLDGCANTVCNVCLMCPCVGYCIDMCSNVICNVACLYGTATCADSAASAGVLCGCLGCNLDGCMYNICNICCVNACCFCGNLDGCSSCTDCATSALCVRDCQGNTLIDGCYCCFACVLGGCPVCCACEAGCVQCAYCVVDSSGYSVLNGCCCCFENVIGGCPVCYACYACEACQTGCVMGCLGCNLDACKYDICNVCFITADCFCGNACTACEAGCLMGCLGCNLDGCAYCLINMGDICGTGGFYGCCFCATCELTSDIGVYATEWLCTPCCITACCDICSYAALQGVCLKLGEFIGDGGCLTIDGNVITHASFCDSRACQIRSWCIGSGGLAFICSDGQSRELDVTSTDVYFQDNCCHDFDWRLCGTDGSANFRCYVFNCAYGSCMIGVLGACEAEGGICITAHDNFNVSACHSCFDGCTTLNCLYLNNDVDMCNMSFFNVETCGFAVGCAMLGGGAGMCYDGVMDISSPCGIKLSTCWFKLYSSGTSGDVFEFNSGCCFSFYCPVQISLLCLNCHGIDFHWNQNCDGCCGVYGDFNFKTSQSFGLNDICCICNVMTTGEIDVGTCLYFCNSCNASLQGRQECLGGGIEISSPCLVLSSVGICGCPTFSDGFLAYGIDMCNCSIIHINQTCFGDYGLIGCWCIGDTTNACGLCICGCGLNIDVNNTCGDLSFSDSQTFYGGASVCTCLCMCNADIGMYQGNIIQNSGCLDMCGNSICNALFAGITSNGNLDMCGCTICNIANAVASCTITLYGLLSLGCIVITNGIITCAVDPV